MSEVRVKLKQEQIQIISGIFAEKQALEQAYQKLIQRENEFIVNLCSAKDIKPEQGIKFEKDEMIVPVVETKTEEVKRRLKKVEKAEA